MHTTKLLRFSITRVVPVFFLINCTIGSFGCINKRNRKAPGEDQVKSEMLKTGEEGRIPNAWKNAEVTILFKKGDSTNIENYRPISLLSVLYKLLTKIIVNRLTNKLEFYQPIEQAGFRKGYSTIDHIQVVRTLIEKCTEYNVPLHLAFVDYQKAFDTLEIWAVLHAMDAARIDSRYSNLIKDIYEHATLHVKVEEDLITGRIPIKREVRQGDTISPKLFTLAMQNAFKNLTWKQNGINIDGQFLSHLRFADDIVLISNDADELGTMLRELKEASEAVGLRINLLKTKIMSPDNIQITLGNHTLEVVEEYVYLGHNIKLDRDNQTAEITRRVGLTWAAL